MQNPATNISTTIIKALSKFKVEELNELKLHIEDILNNVREVITKMDHKQVDSIIIKQQEILNEIVSENKKQIKRIKREEAGTKNNLLYLAVLSETKNLLLKHVIF